MKRKLFNVILALVLCVGLAVPAVAVSETIDLKNVSDARSVLIGGGSAVYGIGDNGKIYLWAWGQDDETEISNPRQLLENVTNPMQLAYYHGNWIGLFVLNTEGDVYYYSHAAYGEGKESGKANITGIVQIASFGYLAVALKKDGTMWIAKDSYMSDNLPGDGFQFNEYKSLQNIVYVARGNGCVLAVDTNNKCYKIIGLGDNSGIQVTEAGVNDAIDSSDRFFKKLPDKNAYVSPSEQFIINEDGTCQIYFSGNEHVMLIDETGQSFKPLLPDYVIFPATGAKRGDVNGDMELDSADLVRLSRHIAEIEPITDTALLQAADVTNDEKVTIADLIRLARFLAGHDLTPLGNI